MKVVNAVLRMALLVPLCVVVACHEAPAPRPPRRPEPVRTEPPPELPQPSATPPSVIREPRSEQTPPKATASRSPSTVSGPIVSVWSEPHTLPPGGGSVQILVRVKKRGGAPYSGVEVRLEASEGRLFSSGRMLSTDGRGMVRDRLTTSRTSTVIVNAGGATTKLWVAVGDFSR